MPRSMDGERFAIRDGGRLRPPRLAVVIEKFAAARGGAQVYTRDILVWLAARGFDVHVVTREVGATERSLPVTFHELREMRARSGFAAAAIERLADVSADISHDMGATAGCDIFQSHVGSPVACQLGADAATPWWYRHARRLAQEFPRRRAIRRMSARQFGSDIHVGMVPDTAAFYAAADIAVQPSFYDACSLATLESLASGLPVITTRANGAAELITPGTDGIVLDEPGDVTALASALRMLAGDRVLRASMGRAARRLATAHGSEASYAKMLGVYAEVLEAKGRPLVGVATSAGNGLRRAA